MQQQIIKKAEISKMDMKLINKLSRREMVPEELYTFSVTLCDNEIDRDFERFTVEALKKLEKLYIGKTGIFDHKMKSENQVARIYDAKLEKDDERITKAGEKYHRLTAKAYMVRTQDNASLIAEIDGGIKKEVSVGCSMSTVKCSVCSADLKSQTCRHEIGKYYSGSLCHRVLDGALDAYEWSFVAVPAQRGAGVTKGAKKENNMEDILKSIKNAKGEITLNEEQLSRLSSHIEETDAMAALGKKYKRRLAEKVVKMCRRAMPEMDCDAFSELAQIMTEKELESFESAFSKRLEKLYPAAPQLAFAAQDIKSENSDFKI